MQPDFPPKRTRARRQPGPASGDPGLDAIRGNSIWGVEGGPPPILSLQTCNDGGAELLRYDEGNITPDVGPSTSTSTSTRAFFGAHLDGHVDRPSTLQLHEGSDTEDDPERNAKQILDPLEEVNYALLQSSRQPFKFKGDRHYIPIDRLRSIVNLALIRTLLPSITKDVDCDRFDDLAQEIYGNQNPDRSFQKVLAILILIEKADSILDFVRAGIRDARLPLQRMGDNRACVKLRLSDHDKPDPIPLFEKWGPKQIEEFENRQWETLAPIFSLGAKDGRPVPRRYDLTSRHPLPFDFVVPESGGGHDQSAAAEGMSRSTASTGSFDDPMEGGYGKVSKIEIHRAHDNLPSYGGCETRSLFGLKKLNSPNLDVFENEVEILTRLNNCQDPHLVKLLATMHITKSKGPPGKRSRFYLMFPLADSNLRQFWAHNLKFLDAEGTTPTAFPRWVARQFHGLAIALGKLHDLNETEGHGPQTHQDDRRPGTKDPSYGIHGDIKPDNMLWYRTWVGPSPAAPADQEHLGLTQPAGSPDHEPHGVIQLADFGISSLHHTRTRSHARLDKTTKTYAPPEVELPDHPCSRSFDIWSLGCVFLEFMCWLVQGGSGSENPVDTFQKARYLEDRGEKNTSLWGTLQDTFYVVTDKDKQRFDVNPAVKERIETLRESARSKFVTDALAIIEDDMLVVEPMSQHRGIQEKAFSGGKYRIDCVGLVGKLGELVQKGNTDDDYFTMRGLGSQC